MGVAVQAAARPRKGTIPPALGIEDRASVFLRPRADNGHAGGVMSRQLPSKANFDYLKKQAKELRAELSREQPHVQLADAQRLLAREYGFPTWAALKAHVTETPGRAFAGTWQVDLARSKRP